MGPIPTADFPTATLTDVPSSFTIVEEDMTIEIPVTLDKPWDFDSEVFIEQIDGDATSDDIEVSSARIANGATEGTIEIVIHRDAEAEDTESATFRIVEGGNVSLASNPEFTITLENYVSPDLDIAVTWGGEFNEEAPDDLVDFDLYIYSFDLEEDVDAAETGGFESLTLSGDLPDGDYLVYAFLYADYDAGDFGPIDLPINLEFSRDGVFSGLMLPQSPDEVISTAAPDYVNDEAITLVELAIITKEDGKYYIKNLDEVVIGSGLKGHVPDFKPVK